MIFGLLTTALVILCLNEIDGMRQIVPKIKKEWVNEIVLVDGGSTDGSIDEAKKLGLRIINQKIKGHGAAILAGVNSTKSDNIVFFGPDGNHEPEEIPLLIASNTSMGIALFKKIIDYSKEVLNVASSVEIHEQHHEEKKDSPSGTAINLKDQLKEILPNKDIQIVSSREGDSPGVHTIKLSFEDETLEISHKASDRSIFAKGAIIAGKWLKDKPPGLYTMQDIYS